MQGIIILIVVVIIVISVIKKNKQKKIAKEKAMEDIVNCRGYDLAIKIMDELKKKGFTFRELNKSFIVDAQGGFWGNDDSDSSYTFKIEFSISRAGLRPIRNFFILRKVSGQQLYGIENDNVSIIVYVDSIRNLPGMPECLKIAAEVIKNNGYGPCTEIKG